MSDNLNERFEQACRQAFELPEQSSKNLLKLYALFKQATEGDAQGARPGLIQMKARAKFDAWKECLGISQSQAKEDYIQLVQKLSDDAQ